ncbi:hypothetical protein O181_021914 [Austropuccinia psidii MF-1]|uniref:Uncharacterized protein n=1 Tax=Austropuccinia psidii MF-1 TaxID=1389203 RepID=A0A9Q3GX52_9BASI|nr:hypothetical protein [Austropuccinia psidii MF-1]
MSLEVETIDEISSFTLAMVDEVQSNVPTTLPERSDVLVDEIHNSDKGRKFKHPPQINVIGLFHPALISCDITAVNILPNPRMPQALVTSEEKASRSLKGGSNLPKESCGSKP